MVEYQDLGLTLKTTPSIMRSGEVALKIDLEDQCSRRCFDQRGAGSGQSRLVWSCNRGPERSGGSRERDG